MCPNCLTFDPKWEYLNRINDTRASEISIDRQRGTDDTRINETASIDRQQGTCNTRVNVDVPSWGCSWSDRLMLNSQLEYLHGLCDTRANETSIDRQQGTSDTRVNETTLLALPKARSP